MKSLVPRLVSLTHRFLMRLSIRALPALVLGLGAGLVSESLYASGGRVVCWGSNASGESSVPANATNIVAIAAGSVHTLALVENGTLLAWGDGNALPPTSVSHTVKIAAGGFYSMGLRTDGSLWTWGGGPEITNVPPAATNVVRLSAGNIHLMVLRADGQVVAWGYNPWGQTDVPAAASNVVEIAAGGIHSMALRRDGTVVVWGEITRVPAAVTNVVAVGANYDHCLALRQDGTVVEWDQYNDWAVPAGLSEVLAISSGSATLWVAQRRTGAVSAWSWTPVPGENVPPGLGNVCAVAAGGGHGVALVDYQGLEIRTPPRDALVLAGEAVSFSCEIRGAMPMSFGWDRDGHPVSGAPQPFVILPDAQAEDAGQYRLTITNASGSTTAPPATLTVVPSVPRLMVTPDLLVVLRGATASFSASARGLPTRTHCPRSAR